MSEKSSKNKHTSSSYHKQITYEQVVLMKFGIKQRTVYFMLV